MFAKKIYRYGKKRRKGKQPHYQKTAVGTVDRFNNGKKCEERDRVKHKV